MNSWIKTIGFYIRFQSEIIIRTMLITTMVFTFNIYDILEQLPKHIWIILNLCSIIWIMLPVWDSFIKNKNEN